MSRRSRRYRAASLAVGVLGTLVSTLGIMPAADAAPPKTAGCNAGGGNGPEGCDPGNSPNTPGSRPDAD